MSFVRPDVEGLLGEVTSISLRCNCWLGRTSYRSQPTVNSDDATTWALQPLRLETDEFHSFFIDFPCNRGGKIFRFFVILQNGNDCSWDVTSIEFTCSNKLWAVL
jgi:hypothetical protein